MEKGGQVPLLGKKSIAGDIYELKNVPATTVLIKGTAHLSIYNILMYTDMGAKAKLSNDR
jgi:hypothetical protein